jgi:uncharacterized protein YndB with AHSA1/START domain
MDDPITHGDATLSTAGHRPVVRFERILARAPEAVWRAITDPEALKAWFPCGVVADSWRPGATISFPFAGGPTLTGVVLEAEEPRVLAYTWGEETLRFTLTPEPGGRTRLVLTDELDSPFAARNAAGWQVCLARLTGQEDDAGDAWKQHFDRYTAAFEPALGPQEGPPGEH